MAGIPILRLIAVLFNVVALVLCCLILFSGFGAKLTEIYWMGTDTSAFSLPAPLASSDYLQAISKVSGTDLVGETQTAASFFLPQWTSIHLFTDCAHYPDRVECTDLAFAHSYTPFQHFSHWKLEVNLPDPGLSAGPVAEAVEFFQKNARFLKGGFIAAGVLSLGAPIEAFLAPLWACITSAVASIVLLAVMIMSTKIFTKLSTALNDEFGKIGIWSKPGMVPVGLGFAAFALSLVATVLYVVSYLRRPKTDGMGRTVGGEGLGRDHKYVQIDEQQGGAGVKSQTSGVTVRDLSPDSVLRSRRMDEDWAAPDEYASTTQGPAKTSSGPSGASIPMMPLGGNKQKRDLNTGYEPYSDPR